MLHAGIDSFVFDKLIGTGSFASVWLAHGKRSAVPVAIKKISKSLLSDTTLLIREISIMRAINHPFLTQFFDAAEDSDSYYIVQEYASGRSLTDRISEQGPMPEQEARHYFIQLICALDYLHNTRRVAHRDIKGDNILFDSHNNIKVIDFGLSHAFVNPEDQFKTACGSPCCAAPELVRRLGYTASVDIWSSSIVLFYMVAGTCPFLGSDIQSTFRLILRAQPEFPRTMSDSLVDLLRKMLTKDPEGRITLEGIKQHPWFSLNWYNALLRFAEAAPGGTAQANGLDPQVIARMENDGIDCTGLPQTLLAREQTELTTLYAIYRRNRATEQMAALIASGQAADLCKSERRMSLQTKHTVGSMVLQRTARQPMMFPRGAPQETVRRTGPAPLGGPSLRKQSADGLHPWPRL
jgi:hypothetical protein